MVIKFGFETKMYRFGKSLTVYKKDESELSTLCFFLLH
ncbi:hypothetical protein BTJ45_03266 [Bacillus mycoides]|nr:hypothetical protein BTJ45_03266 [Bacillus mycoides]